MFEVNLSLIGQKVNNNIAENSVALGHDTHNSEGVKCAELTFLCRFLSEIQIRSPVVCGDARLACQRPITLQGTGRWSTYPFNNLYSIHPNENQSALES